MTELRDRFLKPATPPHRRYEALRAHFVDGASAVEAAERFGYSYGSFRNLCSEFRRNPDAEALFAGRRPGPEPGRQTPDTRRRDERAVELRRQSNLSAADISRRLAEEGITAGQTTVQRILRQAGFPKLPRRPPKARLEAVRPQAAPVADAAMLDLSPRRFRTDFGGLFLFAPDLVRLDLDAVVSDSGMPGSAMIPAGHAFRSLLALKLWGIGRPPHIMADVMDPGLALFAGLNAVPKRASLTEYSCRVDPRLCAGLMDRWHGAVRGLDVDLGGDGSFDLDFHTIPYHGDAALIEKHYVSKRSRRQKGILAFLARDADARILCYANANVRKADQNDEILRFVEFWRRRHGDLPRELVFDSRLTTHANLAELDRMGIGFLTLRKRTRKLLDGLAAVPDGEWRRVRLTNVGREYRTPQVLDRKVRITGYPGDIRQLAVRDLGHANPTLLLTNQAATPAGQLVDRYARRMVIENAIAEAIDLFHMDALSAAVPMKVDLDLQLTLMAGTLYRLLAVRLGNGRQDSKARTLFRDFVKAAAEIAIEEDSIIVRIGRRANNPFLLNAGYGETDIAIPWLGNRRMQIQFV